MKQKLTQRKFWTETEDKLLVELQTQHPKKWKYISQGMIRSGFQRNSRACKDRFVNFLDPKILVEFPEDDIDNLFEFYKQFGSQWSLIGKKFKCYSLTSVKNKFYSLIRKTFRRLLKSIDGKKSSAVLNSYSSTELQELIAGDGVYYQLLRKYACKSLSVIKEEILCFEKEIIYCLFDKKQVLNNLRDSKISKKIQKQNDSYDYFFELTSPSEDFHNNSE